jgi:hypothetical protein
MIWINHQYELVKSKNGSLSIGVEEEIQNGNLPPHQLTKSHYIILYLFVPKNTLELIGHANQNSRVLFI